MGEVFDVTRAAQHYERAGGYNCFAGRDGSRCTLALELSIASTSGPALMCGGAVLSSPASSRDRA
jgi:hypothetical protein